jgi:general secretion pathway protein H
MEPTDNRVVKERMRISSVGNKKRSRDPREEGITLLELVITLALLSLSVALVAPRFGNWIDEWTLRSAAERLGQAVRDARARALFEQSYYVMEIDSGAHEVRVFDTSSRFTREFELPAGARVSDGELPEPPVVRLLFSPSGTVEERTLTLSRSGSKFTIHVDFLLGGPVVTAVKQGG